jgi:hypothetical protein
MEHELRNWEKTARGLLRAEMARRNISYKELSRRLETIGVLEKEKQLMNKVARGKFAFTFFLQCMCAMEVDSLLLPEIDKPKT